MKATPLRIGIDARLISGRGGIEQFVIGLASGLSKLADGDEQYLFLTFRDHNDWIRPYIYGPCQVLQGPSVPLAAKWKMRVSSAFPMLRSAWSKLANLSPYYRATLPRSDGTIEKAGVEVMHIPFPLGFLTEVPTIYHPWDLQHLHLPQFFGPGERKRRETSYRAFCEQAQMVSVPATCVKNDLIAHYGLSEEKIWVIPGGSVLDAYPIPGVEDLKAAQTKFNLPETFVFYPAQTWPHKNHLGLLEALAILRRDGLRIPFVSSGRRYGFYAEIERKARELGLTGQVQFLGFVTPLELQCLYKLCRCMVFPSKFEGFGLPLVEAFSAGVPAACSNVTSLPEVAGEAALLFDPEDPVEIADAIRRLWNEGGLRTELVDRGRRVASRLTWDRTARIFRAHYRRLAARPLTDADRELIQEPPFN